MRDAILLSVLVTVFWAGGYKLGARKEKIQVIAAAVPRESGLPVAADVQPIIVEPPVSPAVPAQAPAPQPVRPTQVPAASVKPAASTPTKIVPKAAAAPKPVVAPAPAAPIVVPQPQPTTKVS